MLRSKRPIHVSTITAVKPSTQPLKRPTLLPETGLRLVLQNWMNMSHNLLMAKSISFRKSLQHWSTIMKPDLAQQRMTMN